MIVAGSSGVSGPEPAAWTRRTASGSAIRNINGVQPGYLVALRPTG
ncbi:hypothetical protein ACWDRR_33675 [Kitasatospora sp. NPDC003701]